MDQHTKRLAAAAYDRGCEAPAWAEDRARFVSVDLGAGSRRTLLCDLTLAGDPPESLRVAVADTIAVLRVAWIAMLHQEDVLERRRLEAAHAAIQCELAAVDWAWSSGGADARSLARTLVARRERHRQALAMPPPAGMGLLVPGRARATEAFPCEIEEAFRRLAPALAGEGRAGADRLRQGAYEAIGAWRLGEREASWTAAAIEAHLAPPASTPAPALAPPASEAPPALLEAS